MRIRTVLTSALLLFALCLSATSTVADTVMLRDGTKFEGTFLGATQRAIRFEVRGQHRAFAIDDVQSISFAPPPAEVAEQNRQISKDPDSSVAGAVPTGTIIQVMLAEGIDSRKNAPGHSFEAVLETNLVADGWIVAHRGAQVFGIVTRAPGSGTDTASNLTLEITSVAIDDANHALVAELETALVSNPSLIVPKGRTLAFRLTSPFKL